MSDPAAFIDYWNAVDAVLQKLFGIHTGDADIDTAMIAAAQEDGETPEDFARRIGEKYGLTEIAHQGWYRPRIRITESDLRQFTGTENWDRHSLNRAVLYTDGARYLADQCGAYWLLDEIALAQRYEKRVAGEAFQVWKLTVNADRSALLSCDEGKGNEVFSKKIPFTDFPMDSISLYFTDRVILLPSEY